VDSKYENEERGLGVIGMFIYLLPVNCDERNVLDLLFLNQGDNRISVEIQVSTDSGGES
jgi:hypothetical protein